MRYSLRGLFAAICLGASAAAPGQGGPPAPPPTPVLAPTSAVLSVSSSSSRVALPASVATFGTAYVYNDGATEAFFAVGSSSVVATTSSTPLPPGTGLSVWVGGSADVAAITASGSTTVRITQANGAITMRGSNPNGGTPGGACGGDLTGTFPNCQVASSHLASPLPLAQGGTGNTTGKATINANLTGPITSTGNATAVGAQTGTGSTFVMQASPTLTTPNLGTPSAAVLTNATGTAAGLTAGAVTGFSPATGKILTLSNTLTLSGTDNSTLNIGAGGTLGSAAYANTGTSGHNLLFGDGTNTWSGAQTWTNSAWNIGNGFFINTTQPNNAFGDFIVPLSGTTYHDNVLTLQNNSVSNTGQCGNAAIRLKESTAAGGYEVGAVGYSVSNANGSCTGFQPRRVFLGGGNITADTTNNTGFALNVGYAVGIGAFPGAQFSPLDIDPDTTDFSSYDHLNVKRFFSKESDHSFGINGGLAVGGTYYTITPPTDGAIIRGAVGIGTNAPNLPLEVGTKEGGQVPALRVADTRSSAGGSGNASYGEVISNRGDGNSSFEAKLGLSHIVTSGTAIAANNIMGAVLFGGQWGTDTSFTQAKLLYPASIQGLAEGSFTAANVMPMGLGFFTGSTGSLIGTINVAYGSERARLDNAGNFGIGWGANPTLANMFSVAGGISIGSGYNVTAPANGAIINGQVVIGATSTTNGVKLEVIKASGTSAIHADCTGNNGATVLVLTAECDQNTSGIGYLFNGTGAGQILLSYNITDKGVVETDGSKLTFKTGSHDPTAGTIRATLGTTGLQVGAAPTGGGEGDGSVNAAAGVYDNGTRLLPTLSGTTGSIGGGALLAGQCTSGTVAITNSTTAMSVIATPVTYPGDGSYWMGYVSTNGTVTVKACATVALTPTASNYNVRVIQ